MKQKQVKVTPKVTKQTNVKKTNRSFDVKTSSEEEHEEVVKKVAAKKPVKKMAAKVEKVVKVSEVSEEEDDDEVEDESEEEMGQDDQDEASDEDGENEDEEELDDDGDEEVDEEEETVDEESDEDVEESDDDKEETVEDEEEVGNGEDADDDEQDEEHDEEEESDDDGDPTIPSKIKSGEIPPTVPSCKIIHIKRLPKNCKQIDIVEAFAIYGAIDQIHIAATPNGSVANVAYKTEKAAKAALAANKKVEIDGCQIEVVPKKPRKSELGKKTHDIDENRERSIYVKYLERNTTEKDVREHFASCGKIVRCKLISKRMSTFAFVTFDSKEAAVAARTFNNTMLNGNAIAVYENIPCTNFATRDPKLTVILKNNQHLERIEDGKLEAIFSKCGEIDDIGVLCKRNVLAFISFKTEEAVKEAFKLNGKTEQGIELEIAEYNAVGSKTSIYVTNLRKDCTEEDLKNHFSKSGEIVAVFLMKGSAIIHFKNSDAYCKSFLLNETYIRNQLVFIEPYSKRKFNIMKSKMPRFLHDNRGRKRPAQNNFSVFRGRKPKVPKMN